MRRTPASTPSGTGSKRRRSTRSSASCCPSTRPSRQAFRSNLPGSVSMASLTSPKSPLCKIRFPLEGVHEVQLADHPRDHSLSPHELVGSIGLDAKDSLQPQLVGSVGKELRIEHGCPP